MFLCITLSHKFSLVKQFECVDRKCKISIGEIKPQAALISTMFREEMGKADGELKLHNYPAQAFVKLHGLSCETVRLINKDLSKSSMHLSPIVNRQRDWSSYCSPSSHTSFLLSI